MAAKYDVRYERDESGWWVASVPAVQGCHTQGRTIEEARRRIRQALSLFVDNAKGAKLVDDVQMPKPARSAVCEYMAAQKKAESEKANAAKKARRAVKMLAGGKLNLSRRDAGEVLGMSHARVQQLLDTSNDVPRRRKR